MHRIFLKSIILVGLMMLFTDCGKDIDQTSKQSQLSGQDIFQKSGTVDEEPEEEMILGRKLNNPYSVANMTMAYDSLLNTNDSLLLTVALSANVNITTTHLYIRFLPSDASQHNYLVNESGLEIFTYPLDYEIVQLGYNYSDIPSSNNLPGYAYLYTVIQVEDAPTMRLPYEILEYCFIPDADSDQGF